MASLNKVMLIGRLTDNPEAPRTLPNSGSTVVKFRFAVGRSRKNPQTGQWENDPNPLYIDCEAFSRPDQKRDLCNVISQFCKKGDQIFIEGRLQLDTWNDKNDPSQKRSKHKVVVEDVQLLSGKGGDGGGMGMGDDAGMGMGGGGGGGTRYNNNSRPPASGGGNRGTAPQRGGYSSPPPPADDTDGDGEGGDSIPF